MTDQATPTGDRLNKYLALHLGLSRREGDIYIEKKRIAINDTLASLGARVLPGDTVTVDGKLIGAVEFAYLALHKPAGYLSSRRSQGDVPTLYTLLPEKYHALKPVGRLDKDSSGLLLLTNDGDFAYRMTHPKFYKVKMYEVQLDHNLEPLHQQMISDYGVQLEDGTSKFMIERITAPHEGVARALGGEDENADSLPTEAEGKAPSYKVTMSEGRNRQIRRTFGALGYTVTALHRTNFGDYSLGDMKPGEYKNITIS